MNEEKIWFNQSLLYQKDKTYTQNGVLEISISNNTSNYQTFAASAINLSVSNDQIRKTQSLNYQNITDLIFSLEEVIRNQSHVYSTSNSGYEIVKKYSQDKTLKLRFNISKSQEKICILAIMNNDTDLSRVVINFDLVLTVVQLFKSFIRDYINVNSNFINRCIASETLDQIKNMRDGIKKLPSFIGTLNSNNPNVLLEVKDEFMEEIDISVVEENINDLDKFLGENMENIKIPEIDSPKKTSEEKNPIIVNDFIGNFLKNDLSILENVLMSSVLTENPFKTIVDNIQNTLQINDSLIPDMSDKDLKSISYISKKFYLEILKKYTIYNEKIPSSITVLKYNILDKTKIKEINKSLSIDLLLILSYFKNLKDKLESREPDAVKNKSLLYLNFRLFMDPLLFTFIETIDQNVLKPLIKDKFNKTISISKYQ